MFIPFNWRHITLLTFTDRRVCKFPSTRYVPKCQGAWHLGTYLVEGNLQTLLSIKVRRVICLQLNSMTSRKLEQYITHKFGQNFPSDLYAPYHVQAILESEPFGITLKDVTDAQKLGSDFATVLGLVPLFSPPTSAYFLTGCNDVSCLYSKVCKPPQPI